MQRQAIVNSKKMLNMYANDKVSMDTQIEQIQAVLKNREDAFRIARTESNDGITIQNYLEEVRSMIVVITDISYLISELDREDKQLFIKLLESGARIGIHFIVGGLYGNLGKAFDDVTKAVKGISSGVLIGRVSDQNIFEGKGGMFYAE